MKKSKVPPQTSVWVDELFLSFRKKRDQTWVYERPRKPKFWQYFIVVFIYDSICAGFAILGYLHDSPPFYFCSGAFSVFAAEVMMLYDNRMREYHNFLSAVAGLSNNFLRAIADRKEQPSASAPSEEVQE